MIFVLLLAPSRRGVQFILIGSQGLPKWENKLGNHWFSGSTFLLVLGKCNFIPLFFKDPGVGGRKVVDN